MSRWMALVIGNSRLHWAYFVENKLEQSWHTLHLEGEAIAHLVHTRFDFTPHTTTPPQLSESAFEELWLASVDPQQTSLWQTYLETHTLDLQQVPLVGMYPTLGIDRALNVVGAMQQWRPPLLVIDAGTALTFTGVGATGALAGGAILPGVSSQLRALHQDTAALPWIRPNADPLETASLPMRWAHNTPAAIQSGVMYGILATLKDFAEDWWRQYPCSTIALTGGDGQLLLNLMRLDAPQGWDSPWPKDLIWEPNLMFWGVQFTRHQLNSSVYQSAVASSLVKSNQEFYP